VEATYSFEKVVSIYQTTRHHNLQDSTLRC